MSDRLQQLPDVMRERELASLYDSPAGGLLLIGDDEALNALNFYRERGPSPRIVKGVWTKNRSLAAARSCLADFFAGKEMRGRLLYRHEGEIREMAGGMPVPPDRLRSDDWPLILNLDGFTLLEINIYRALTRVGFGETVSYSALAADAGIARGARFAGNVMAKNNFPVIIPCHRVIRSDGRPGGYSAGLEIKNKLLEYEKAALPG